MKKKLFKNYSFEFDKNEAKIITTFCKQAINQMSSDERFYTDKKAFASIVDKINADPADVKLTKDEKTRLVLQLKNNIKHINSRIQKSWFIKKWLYRSMLKQYNSIIENHFEE
ncbi:MAG: hypothetical protein KKD86_10995 [Bacteroidetes bacterium]|nr:hypothetical protein [Bacteroidota bacterium]MBU1679356.1 hypothetical protein [Bacteroidota bacterium]